MVKLVLLATVSLNGTKLTFSLVGLMLICLKKVHNKRSTLVNWSKKLVSNLTKHTLQYWNVRSKQLTWLLKLLTNCGFQLKNHGAWTNVTTVVWLVKQSRSCWTIWWWTSSHLASFLRCIASCNGPWWWTLSHTDRRYASLDDSVIPDAENLKVTLERALPFWEDKIAPALKDGKNVFVGAHGNSIRALVKHIKQLSDDEIMDVEIPNFPPLVFEFDDKLNVVKEYYLGK